MSIVLQLKVDDGKLLKRGNDHMWSTIRDLTAASTDTLFSCPEIHTRCDDTVPARTVRNFVQKLVLNGIAEQLPSITGKNGAQLHQFRLLRRPITTPILSAQDGKTALYGRARQQMWDTIRYPLKGGFTVADLITFASTEDVAVSRSSAALYVRALRNAGILLTVKAPRPHHVGTFRIKPSADTGPKAPKVLTAEIVFDANEQRIVSQAIATETGAGS